MRWAMEHPEEMESISRLPLSEQNDALRGAVVDEVELMRRYEDAADCCYECWRKARPE